MAKLPSLIGFISPEKILVRLSKAVTTRKQFNEPVSTVQGPKGKEFGLDGGNYM